MTTAIASVFGTALVIETCTAAPFSAMSGVAPHDTAFVGVYPLPPRALTISSSVLPLNAVWL